MEVFDQTKAREVWQRVKAPAESGQNAQSLLGLIAGEGEDAATYLALSRRFQGREAAMLRRLYEEEQTHTACLKGIYALMTGEKADIRVPPPQVEQPENTLRRCYGWEMKCLAEYEARSADREFGPVFSRLASQEREHCRMVLELIGGLKRE